MKREKVQNEYMFDTKVENIFINEYMISAPGNFVKVYLVALMYIDLGKEMTDEKLAKTLSIEVEEVERAWKYWQDLGVIRKVKGEIVIPQLKEGLYGKQKDKSKVTSTAGKSQGALHILDNSQIKDMFAEIEKVLSRSINGKETDSVLDWIDILGASPEVIAFAFSYCVSKKKENINYIGKVVEGWTNRGFKTVPEVEKFLEEVDSRHGVYKRIMKALGFHRNATEEEKRIIDRWFDEFNFTMEMVLDACKKTSGISNPNINYVNSVLMNWNKEKTGKDENGQVSKKHILDYYEYIRNKAEEEAKVRREEITSTIPEIAQIQDKIRENYMSLSRIAITGGADKQVRLEKIKKENSKLQAREKQILTSHQIPVDYMQVRYKCPICKDTGVLEDGTTCSCYIERAEEAANWERA